MDGLRAGTYEDVMFQTYDEKADEWTKTCIECDFKVVYEKM